MKRYYAKPDTWFKEGSECQKGDEMFPPGSLADGAATEEKTGSSIYRGIYIVGTCTPSGQTGYDTFWYDKGYTEGDEVEMSEHCCDDEFFVVEVQEEKVI